jgi:peptidoglycan/LPS O-acetylase OafA/YrhL
MYLSGGSCILDCMNSGEVWRLGHRPGLDGLRGVAVLMVLALHVGVPGAHLGGQVGVTAFFVLSGFLITSLLLEEWDTLAGIRLSAFYARRALRLAPALIVCVVAVTAFATYVRLPIGPGGAPAALLYYMDFVMADQPPYLPTLLGHTWSLAIEEQFYLVWPVVLIGLLRFIPRRPLVPVLASLTVLAGGWALWVAAHESLTRATYAPDTRAVSLLAGCSLAAACTAGMVSRLPAPVGPAALVSLLALVWVPIHAGPGQMVAVLAATLSAVVVLWSIAVDTGPSPLTISGLRALGDRSYGWYLWHVPLVGFVGAAAPGQPWWVRAAIVVMLTAAIAETSWRWIERPILSRGRRRLSELLDEELSHVRRERRGGLVRPGRLVGEHLDVVARCEIQDRAGSVDRAGRTLPAPGR